MGPVRKFIIEGVSKDQIIQQLFYFKSANDKIGFKFFDFFILNKIIGIVQKYGKNKYGTLT